MSNWKMRNPDDMYKRAKSSAFNLGRDVQFYEFMDWIEKDMNIKSSIFNTEPRSAGLLLGMIPRMDSVCSSASGLKEFKKND